MFGPLITVIKMQLGPLLDDVVIMQSFVPAKTFHLPGIDDVLETLSRESRRREDRSVRLWLCPSGYAAGQVLAQAVEGANSLDHAKIADYIHSHAFQTVVGDIEYDGEGEWAKPRTLLTQFQNVAEGNLAQFGAGSVERSSGRRSSIPASDLSVRCGEEVARAARQPCMPSSARISVEAPPMLKLSIRQVAPVRIAGMTMSASPLANVARTM